jgi:hypothetical protein
MGRPSEGGDKSKQNRGGPPTGATNQDQRCVGLPRGRPNLDQKRRLPARLSAKSAGTQVSRSKVTSASTWHARTLSTDVSTKPNSCLQPYDGSAARSTPTLCRLPPATSGTTRGADSVRPHTNSIDERPARQRRLRPDARAWRLSAMSAATRASAAGPQSALAGGCAPRRPATNPKKQAETLPSARLLMISLEFPEISPKNSGK